MTEISGLIASLISGGEVVINRGAYDGVVVGHQVEVLDPKVTDIRDPATNEVLGSLDRPKAILLISEVQPRFSVARLVRVPRRAIGSSIADALLSISPPTLLESGVQVGDSVRVFQKASEIK